MSRYEKKLKSKLDDEIKLAGLGALVPEELEKHWALNMDCLRIFEDVRLEIVTNDEAKVCLRIRDAKPGDTGSAGHSDPMDVDTVDSPGHLVQEMDVSSAVTFNAFAMHVKATANNRLAKAIRVASRGPRVREKEKGKENNGQSRENPKETRERNNRTQVKALQLAYQALNSRNLMQTQSFLNLNRRFPQKPRSQTAPGVMKIGVRLGGMTDGVQLDGENWDQTCDNSAISLSLGSFDLDATSSPKRFERVRANLDTGAAVNTFLLMFGPEGAGNQGCYFLVVDPGRFKVAVKTVCFDV